MNPYNYSLMDPNIHGTPMFMLHWTKKKTEENSTHQSFLWSIRDFMWDLSL